jgi:hypothetical protein
MNVGSVYYPELPIRHVNFNQGDSDHTSFNNHGYMGIYPFEDYENYSPYIHTVNDLIGTSVNSFAMGQQYCQMNIACLAEIAQPVPDGVINMESDSNVVYPNPSKGTFNLNLGEGQWDIEVYDITGRKVYENLMQGRSALDLGQCQKGLYFMKASSESRSLTTKVVIQ